MADPTTTIKVSGTGTLPDGTLVTVQGPLVVTLTPKPAPAPPPPNVIRLSPTDNLQTAINNAAPGTTLLLPAGATYTGPITLPAKSGIAWITLQAEPSLSLPGPGQRAGPQHAGLMPKIVSPGLNQPAIQTAPGAHHYFFFGIEFAPVNSAAAVGNLIALGDGGPAQSSLAMVPHDLVFDRCYIHGTPDGALKRGIALNSASTRITGCWIGDVHGAGYDTQAICGWNGPGPFEISNNTLEAAGENVMFGGADPSIPNLVPADITIRGNLIDKPLAWRGKWTVKNLLELKNARRVVIDGNRLENNWADAQTGTAINLKSVNQDGMAPWSVTEQVTFTNNLVRHAGGALNIAGTDPGATIPANHITVTNNLFVDIDGGTWGGNGHFLQITGAAGVTIAHNTALSTGNIIIAFAPVVTGFVLRDNLIQNGGAGIKGDGTAVGTASLAAFFPGYQFAGNVLVGADPALYPAGTMAPSDLAACQFVDLAGGNYRLAATSPLRGKATDGRDPGCDIDALTAALGG